MQRSGTGGGYASSPQRAHLLLSNTSPPTSRSNTIRESSSTGNSNRKGSAATGGKPTFSTNGLNRSKNGGLFGTASAASSNGSSSGIRTPEKKLVSSSGSSNIRSRSGGGQRQQQRTPSRLAAGGGVEYLMASSFSSSTMSYVSNSTGGGAPVMSSSKGNSASRELKSDLLKEKLQSLSGVRKQLEALAVKHRQEEESLAKAVSTLALKEQTETKTKAELMQLVEERNRAIRMLDKFRQEGNEVTSRLHQSLKRSQQQNDDLIQQLRRVADENDKLRAVAAASSQGGSPMQSSSGGEVGGEPTSPQVVDPRVPQYQRLLSDADDMLQELKKRNEQLQDKITLLESQQSNSTPIRANAPSEDSATTSPREAPLPTDLEEARSQIQLLRRQLKQEKQARLEAEEFSSKVMVEHRKSVALLEQRISRQEGSPGGGGGGTGATPRRSVMLSSGIPNSARRGTPTAANEATTPNRSQQQLRYQREEIGADPSPEPSTEATPVNDPLVPPSSSTKHERSASPPPKYHDPAEDNVPQDVLVEGEAEEKLNKSEVAQQPHRILDDETPLEAVLSQEKPEATAGSRAQPLDASSPAGVEDSEVTTTPEFDMASPSPEPNAEEKREARGKSQSMEVTEVLEESSSPQPHETNNRTSGGIEPAVENRPSAAASPSNTGQPTANGGRRSTSSKFDHAQAMEELQMLENQLAEVAAELGDN